jgi:hypothetical protein
VNAEKRTAALVIFAAGVTPQEAEAELRALAAASQLRIDPERITAESFVPKDDTPVLYFP